MLEVVEIGFAMEAGATEPINCRLSNGVNAVVKYPNNSCGTMTLINEWIGNSIARAIGVTVPNFGICNLPSSVIFSNSDIDFLDEKNCGACFYSEFVSKAVPKIIWSIAHNREFERILLLDHILNNFDRHIGNMFFDTNSGIIYAIDYSHLFSCTARPNVSSELFLKGMDPEKYLYKDILEANKPVYDEICIGGGYSEDVLRVECGRIQAVITEALLDQIIEYIPSEWVESAEDKCLVKIKDFILFRVTNLTSICEMIIEGRR